MLQRMISVDPGINGTGFALWRGDELFDSGVFRPTRDPNNVWLIEAISIVDKFQERINSNGMFAGLMVIELPRLWGSSAISLASGTKGDLINLSRLCGMLEYVGYKYGLYIKCVYPHEWKGQLSKDAVKQRILRVLPGIKLRDHEADAIGIGLFVQGRL